MQGALRGYGDGAAGGEDRYAFVAFFGAEEFCETRVYAGAELWPRFDTFCADHTSDPIADDGSEQVLKGCALRGVVGGSQERGVEVANFLVFFEQCGESAV